VSKFAERARARGSRESALPRKRTQRLPGGTCGRFRTHAPQQKGPDLAGVVSVATGIGAGGFRDRCGRSLCLDQEAGTDRGGVRSHQRQACDSATLCDSATASAEFRDFGLKVPSMSVDLAHPAAEKIVLVLEGIGDDKIRVNSSSLGHPLVILPDQAIEIVGIEKKVMVGRTMRSAYWLNHDPSGLAGRGLRAGDEVTCHSVMHWVSVKNLGKMPAVRQ
jgi:hypothetical protein